MIGLLGGTFDPVHFGHLRPGLEVAEALNLTELRIIPSATPPHRWQPQASAEHRIEMVNLAIQNILPFTLDTREYQRDGASYTIDTLRDIRRELGNEEPLCMLLGQDAFQSFNSWHQWQAILDYTHIVVSTRPGYDLSATNDQGFKTWIENNSIANINDLHAASCGSIAFLNVTQLDISATEIRKRLLQGKSCHFLTPETVVSYIEKHNLYITDSVLKT